MKQLKLKLYRSKEKVKRKIEQLRYGKCSVLLYHRVCLLDNDPQLLAVSPVNFEEHLNILKQEYHLLSVDAFEQLIGTGGRFPDRSVLITFDDGYVDNYTEALPLLEKKAAQALFYICTGNIGNTNEFWWDKAERVLLNNSSEPDKAIQLDIEGTTYSLRTNEEYRIFYNSILPVLRKMKVEKRDAVLEHIAVLRNRTVSRESHRSMSLTELKEFSASPAVCIGAHTQNHPSLAALNYSEQMKEIAESKEFLEEKLNKQIKHFSYPFGNHEDFNPLSEKVCRELNFSFVAANIPGVVTAKTKPFSFPRFIVRNWEPDEFRKQLSNFFEG